MMATGTVVLATDPVVEQLRQTAISLVNSQPTLTPQKLTLARYAAATKFEDAMDLIERNPATANMIVSEAVRQMLQFAFLQAGRFIPRDKDILDTLMNMDSDLASKAKLFFESGDWTRRMHLATELADRILQVRGFFEWTSEPEDVSPPAN
jgi:hypothetical protein